MARGARTTSPTAASLTTCATGRWRARCSRSASTWFRSGSATAPTGGSSSRATITGPGSCLPRTSPRSSTRTTTITPPTTRLRWRGSRCRPRLRGRAGLSRRCPETSARGCSPRRRRRRRRSGSTRGTSSARRRVYLTPGPCRMARITPWTPRRRRTTTTSPSSPSLATRTSPRRTSPTRRRSLTRMTTPRLIPRMRTRRRRPRSANPPASRTRWPCARRTSSSTSASRTWARMERLTQ
mmetsp:Transcript_10461/g.29260  ORF Transcript_10461/g.29260 Transcript_10461/m.29260 type:complete len:239 (+) Transcript_10461:192-908(+)